MKVYILAKHTSSGYIDLCVKLNGHSLSLGSIVNLLIGIENALDLSSLTTWQGSNLISDMDLSDLNLSLETTEGTIRTADTLYRHNKSGLIGVICHIDGLQIILKSTALVPRCLCRLCGNIVTNCCRYRDNMHGLKIILSCHDLDLLGNVLKLIFIIVNKIHFIDSIYHMLNTH